MHVRDQTAGPLQAGARIVAIDALRGFAVLGILLMNVQSYGMIGASYFNPAASGHFGGVDSVLWALVHLLADQKFMTVFSLLFGAGIVLMSERTEGAGRSPAKFHYTRQMWLLLIGAAHAYLLWMGDILFTYAIAAMVVFGLRRRSPRTLLMVGVGVLCVPFLISMTAGLSLPHWSAAEIAQEHAEWAPSATAVAAETAAYRGGWLAQMAYRVPDALAFQTLVLLVWGSWRAAGLMLVGMALFKLGVLTGARDDRFYARLTLVGFGLGLPVVAYGTWRHLQASFSVEWSMFLGSQFNYWASIPVALGYVGVLMLACRRDWLPGVRARLAACGRMALSNYLGQSLLATLVFYGYGLGLFERLDRFGQLLVVLAIWALQLWLSTWWLDRYRFGPAEWAWRSLTYLRRQPLRLQAPAMAIADCSTRLRGTGAAVG